MKIEVIAACAMILADLFNLAEQFGVFFITKEAALDETAQQRFFFVLFGIGGAMMIRPMMLWSKLKVIFSVLIEIAELICYLVLLPRTTNLIVVASVFFAIQVLLHVITFITITSDCDEIDCQICVCEYVCFPLRVLAYAFLYSSPMLFLFLDPYSKFRDTFYEILLILNVFFGVGYIDMSFSPRSVTELPSSSDKKISYLWQWIIVFIYSIIGLIILITTMVFAGQAINKHATGEEVLKQYDFGVYIYCLVNYGLLACAELMNCCSLYLRFCKAKSN